MSIHLEGEVSDKYVLPEDVSITKMASKKFEGWKILYDGKSAGYVKFYFKEDDVFQKHVTIDFKVPIPLRGRHIGRIALAKAIDKSTYTIFVAHLRGSNVASKRSLESIGFVLFDYPGSRQLCLLYKKEEGNN
ncbi:hypothetical protein [Candidatus Neptunochlamydia vexilliferae]|uniref:hypothetical protein n=1 Tax=Candidatus Neptunichlamydia vexilliferae TaxID=1651774 RepID=UPI001891CC01|nr:hypothetical protein [Candidatus Neptunochlamydia vexilliferae]